MSTDRRARASIGTRPLVLLRTLLALAACLASAEASAAPMTMVFYCSANASQAKTEYMTGIFSAAADKRDVISAWRQYLEDKHIEFGQALSCDAGVKVSDLKAIQDASRASIANIQWRIVDVDWTFTGQVAASQPNMIYGYCQSGTSVANATYFSDVFGLTLAQVTPNAFVAQFFDYVRAKYGNPPGLGTGSGTGPNGEWCAMVGNIADAERDKKAWEDKLRSPSRRIIDTGWRFGQAPSASATNPAAPATPPSPAAPAPAQSIVVTQPASGSAQSYYCLAYSMDKRYNYFTAVRPLDADRQDVVSAWHKYTLAGRLSGIFENNSQMGCETGTATQMQSNLDGYKKRADQRAKAQPAYYRSEMVDWKFTPDQLATLTKPGATYGFCWYQDPAKTVKYVSAAFEMPAADIAAGNVVMFNQFAQDLHAKRGVSIGGYDPRSGACVQQGGATMADDNRIKFETAARQSGEQVVETGWTFVRTAQTPPPGPPVIGHGHGHGAAG